MTNRLLKSLAALLLFSMPLFRIGAATAPNAQWTEIRPADVEGRLWDDVECPFDRIPTRMKRVLPGVWGNGVTPTGQLVDFESDSRNISVKVKYASNRFGELNFNYVAFSGFDLYIFDKGMWRWAATMGHGTKWATDMTYPLLEKLPPGKRRYRLYLPLRNRLLSVALGTDAGSKTALIPPRRDNPVIYYGTSIIHGAFACRAGLGLTSRLGRALDCPIVNLGFSGGAKLEPAMAELMAEKEASVYVCDPFHNLSVENIRANFEKFFDILCSKQPTTPVILLGAPHRCNLWMWPDRLAVEEAKTRLFEELAPKVAAKHKNFRYVPGQNLYGNCEWSMDGVHPNDEAFANMTKILTPILRAAMDKNSAPADELARKQYTVKIPLAPERYRRPKDWKPVLYPKSLHQIAKDHSAETMALAKKQMEKVRAVNAKGKYPATGKAMDAHKCPEWFVDAKLGMFIDWGPYSLASWCPYVKGQRLYTDWYEMRSRTVKAFIAYHNKNWGPDFKPDHFMDLFRAKDFDAPKLMKFFRECGAKYVIPFLNHHSGFTEWDCSYTFRDTVDQGPRRDLAKEIADACRAEGLKFGVYNSQAAEWEYPILQNDGSLKILQFDGRTQKPYTPEIESICSGKIPVKDFVYDYKVPQMTEFVDKYDPDILWFDGDWMTPAAKNGSYEITAYFYNKAEGRKEVACNDRYGLLEPAEIQQAAREGKYKPGVKRRNWARTVRGDYYTDEWGDTEENLDPSRWHPWESCSGMSMCYGNHWMENYDSSLIMSEKQFIVHFADIVARGGCLLLLVNLEPQGSLRKNQEERLRQIGTWLKRYGEAIYATRICAPFKTAKIDYTQSKDGKTAYAIVKEPAAEIALECELPDSSTVTIIGTNERLATRRDGKRLVVSIPPAYAAAPLPFALRCTR